MLPFSYITNWLISLFCLSVFLHILTLSIGICFICMEGQTSLCSCNGDYYFIEKAKGIEYLYAWLDRHPNVSLVEKGTFLSPII